MDYTANYVPRSEYFVDKPVVPEFQTANRIGQVKDSEFNYVGPLNLIYISKKIMVTGKQLLFLSQDDFIISQWSLITFS